MATLTKEQKTDLRSLRDLGFTEAELSEFYETSISTVSRTLAAGVPKARMDALRAAHEQIERERWAANPKFAGFEGDAARLVADIFDCPTDGGDALIGPDGQPREC